jgi:hypothetical protein
MGVEDTTTIEINDREVRVTDDYLWRRIRRGSPLSYLSCFIKQNENLGIPIELFLEVAIT